MKELFRRQRQLRDASVVTLTPTPSEQSASLQIRHPDALSPLPHAVLKYNPHEHVDELRAEVRAKVVELGAAGALDQDNLNALFLWLDSRYETWVSQQRHVAESRRKVSGMLLAQITQNLRVATIEFTHARRRHDENARARDLVFAELGLAAVERTDDFEHLLDDDPSILASHLPILTTPTKGTVG